MLCDQQTLKKSPAKDQARQKPYLHSNALIKNEPKLYVYFIAVPFPVIKGYGVGF